MESGINELSVKEHLKGLVSLPTVSSKPPSNQPLGKPITHPSQTEQHLLPITETEKREIKTNVLLREISTWVTNHIKTPGKHVSFTYKNKKDGVEIINYQNFSMNSFLPNNVRIVDTPTIEGKPLVMEARGTKVYVDMKRAKELGIIGAAAIAHEIGHAINPNTNDNTQEFKRDRMYEENLHVLKGAEKVHAACTILNNRLRDEIEAWNYGKLFATVMGIDEMHYEDLMQYCIKSYYTFELQRIRNAWMTAGKPIDSQETFKIYNPSLQTEEEISFADLQAFVALTNPTIDPKTKRVTDPLTAKLDHNQRALKYLLKDSDLADNKTNE